MLKILESVVEYTGNPLAIVALANARSKPLHPLDKILEGQIQIYTDVTSGDDRKVEKETNEREESKKYIPPSTKQGYPESL